MSRIQRSRSVGQMVVALGNIGARGSGACRRDGADDPSVQRAWRIGCAVSAIKRRLRRGRSM